MSRISRYQVSVDRFIQTKSALISISGHNRPHLDFMYNEFDHLIAICLVSILNNRCKKAKLKFHGYYIASGIDIALAVAKITDNYEYYKKKIGILEVSNYLPELVSIMYQSLSGNIDSLKLNASIEDTMRISQYCINYMSSKIGGLTVVRNCSQNERISKTDFDDYKFSKESHRHKYKHFKKISDADLMKIIDDKYGAVCKMSLIFGWMLGLGDEKNIPELEAMGTHMGIIFKIAYDFANIENDLEYCSDYTYNIVINKGIKECVEMFLGSKACLIEGIFKLDIWSTTLKEILGMIEKNIDDALERTNIDEKYIFSEFSSTDTLSEKVNNTKKGKILKIIKSNT